MILINFKEMFGMNMDYTVCSTKEESYNKIECSLVAPQTALAKMVVTNLTTKCAIIVLGMDDFIEIEHKKYFFENEYTDLNPDTFIGVLNEIITVDGYGAFLDEAGRIDIRHKQDFIINNSSYNVKLLTGFYNSKFPLSTDIYGQFHERYYSVKAFSVGYTLSTPIMYLTCNYGQQSYRNLNSEMKGSKIVMRLNNSFSSGYPIVAQNGDFPTTLCSNDLSHVEFTLLDANMKNVRLLSPMYLSINIQAIPDEELPFVEPQSSWIDVHGMPTNIDPTILYDYLKNEELKRQINAAIKGGDKKQK